MLAVQVSSIPTRVTFIAHRLLAPSLLM